MLLRKLSQSLKITMALMLSVLSSGLLPAASASAATAPDPDTISTSISYCHAKPADTAKEGWNLLTTSPNVVFQSGHTQHAADIIPPFTYEEPGRNGETVKFNGMNWNVVGQAIYENDCATSDETVTPELNTCETWGPSGSTNLNANGWTLSTGAAYVEGGVKLSVADATNPAVWDEATITRALSGDLAELGTDITFTPGTQYLGLHVETSAGTLVYEQEPSYGGKWWSNDNFNVATGMGYETFDTLENIVAANPGVTLKSLAVLYTNPTAASTTVTSVKIGCVEYTFDKEEVPTPEPVVCEDFNPIHSTNLDHNGWTLIRGAEYVDGGMKLSSPGDWTSGKISRTMTGTLADLGDVISYSPDAQYLGLHIETEEGWLTYESAYGGNWWLSGATENMKNKAPHDSGSDVNFDGQGSRWYGTLDEWVAAFPELQVKQLVVLYTNGVPGSTTVTSVKIGCVEYTFDQVGGNVNDDDDQTSVDDGHVLADTDDKSGKVLSSIAPAKTAVLPATIPATGNAMNPFIILVASLAAYGAAYFAQGRRRVTDI